MCHDCECARESKGAYRLYTPACLWCGARLIKAIQALPRPANEIAARCRQVLNDWVAYGHSETQIRALAKAAEMPLAPSGEPAPPPKAKPR